MSTFSIKGPGLAELRHNLRTPLNHILGYGEMLIEDAEELGDEKLLAELRQIHERGKQDRKSTRLNSSHIQKSRMPSSA